MVDGPPARRVYSSNVPGETTHRNLLVLIVSQARRLDKGDSAIRRIGITAHSACARAVIVRLLDENTQEIRAGQGAPRGGACMRAKTVRRDHVSIELLDVNVPDSVVV